MTLWFLFGLMTAAALFAVLWPLARRQSAAHGGSDLLVYKDQLQEIDRDRAAGLIGETEAEAARLEISRRLLAVQTEATRGRLGDKARRTHPTQPGFFSKNRL